MERNTGSMCQCSKKHFRNGFPEENVRRLGNSTITGQLLRSSEELRDGRSMVSPLQDAMNNQAREVWLLECIPAVAEGTMTPAECWQRVMTLNPFGE